MLYNCHIHMTVTWEVIRMLYNYNTNYLFFSNYGLYVVVRFVN